MPANDYKQYDGRWSGNAYGGGNYASDGCGPTSAADIISAVTGATPLDVGEWMKSAGYSCSSGGTYWEGIPAALKAFGADGKQLCYNSLYGDDSSSVFNTFKDSVKSGYMGILLMGPGYWTSSGHFIAIVNYRNSDDAYQVYDPASEARTGWHNWADFAGQIKIPYTSTITWGAVSDCAYEFTPASTFDEPEGTNVLLVQEILRARGINPNLGLTQKADEATVEAIKKYQSLRNMEVDGYAGKHTIYDMLGFPDESSPIKLHTVTGGEEGVHVLLVQEILRARGYKGVDGKPIVLDGKCGDNTVNAIITFQQLNGLDNDGIAGHDTLETMIAI